MKHGIPLLTKKIKDLSVIVSTKNKRFSTANNILENKQAGTELIITVDGPPMVHIPDHPDIRVIYHSEPIGEKAVIEEATKLSQAKQVMTIDEYSPMNKGIVYYTDNQAEERIYAVARKILLSMNIPIISVSQYPIDFGKNFVMELNRSHISMFKQVLKGVEESAADIIYLCEHDLFYHKSHFDFIPAKENVFYFNQNRWAVDILTGTAIYYKTYCPSLLIAHRELLLSYYSQRVAILEKEGFTARIGNSPPRGVKGDWSTQKIMSKQPVIDIRHSNNLTPNRFNKKDFTKEGARKGWKTSESVPGWGKTYGRMSEFIRELYND